MIKEKTKHIDFTLVEDERSQLMIRHSESCLPKRTNEIASCVSLSAFFRHPELVSGSIPNETYSNSETALTGQTNQVVILNSFQNLFPLNLNDNRETSPTGQTNIDRSRTKFGMTSRLWQGRQATFTLVEDERSQLMIRHSESCLPKRTNEIASCVSRSAFFRHPELVSGSIPNETYSNSETALTGQTNIDRSRTKFGMTSRLWQGRRVAFTLAEGGRSPLSNATKNTKAAFTLAEVLITLGIIGIVAALTIPNLVRGYQEKVKVNQLKKVYSVLSEAFKMATVEHGAVRDWGLTGTSTGKKDEEGNAIYDQSAEILVAQRIKPYLRISRQCKDGEMCETRDIYALSGILKTKATAINDSKDAKPSEAQFYLSDGTFLELGWATGDRFELTVTLPDKNKVQGINNFGFAYLYSEGQLLPQGFENGKFDNDRFKKYCNKTWKGDSAGGKYCTAWVIYKENMDYLHCPEKLSWDGAKSCKSD